MTDEEITKLAKDLLRAGNEDAFVAFLKDLRAANIPQGTVYECLLPLQR
jgi:hypothetical protein